jgi:HD superfamily phosphohydrolase YqeK
MPSFDVGYFQSYKWASEPEIFGKMMNLRLRDCKKIEKIKELAEREKPVIVHFRFGDYLAEENFGIPSSQYYREAVNAIRERTSRDRTFWIFSDDVEKAKVIIDEISLQKTKYFSSNQFSSSETFEIMRMGTDYVIANSTFSWWAAFLRYSRAGIVVAPTPWFKGLPTPADLIPLEWIQIEAVF